MQKCNVHTSSNNSILIYAYALLNPETNLRLAVHHLSLLCKRNVGQRIHMYVMPAVEAATLTLMGTCQY